MSNESIIRSLLGSTEFDDPRLYDLLDKMLNDFYKVYYNIYPPSSHTFGLTGAVTGVSTVQGFTATVYGNNLRLTWNALSGAVSYELRYKAGTSTDWDTANSLFSTTTLTADLNPITLPLTYGNHTFLIKATDSLGTQSSVAASVLVNITQISAPSVTATVIDNNVLLKWTVPSSVLNLAYYNVYKDASFIGKMDGTFEVIFETVAGTYTYTVEAVDIVGNVGTLAGITVVVNQPPDYQLQDDFTSTLNGTRVYAAHEGSNLIVIVDTCGV